MNYKIREVTRLDVTPFVIDIHYAHRFPSASHYFGMFDGDELIGVILYGSPPSHSLTIGVCGKEYKHEVIELQRLVLKYNRKNEASYLIGGSFKLLPRPKIIISYADTSQDHLGKVYQATNFIYTGLSDKRTEWQMIEETVKSDDLFMDYETTKSPHSKTLTERYTLEYRQANPDKFKVVDRPQKHRYIYFLGSKSERRNYMNKLNYKIQDYPKKG
jgi:hypothetical protein